jgi:hypothetical protein
MRAAAERTAESAHSVGRLIAHEHSITLAGDNPS